MTEPAKLLLVDDEPGIRESVQAYLEDSGEFQVTVASNAIAVVCMVRLHSDNEFKTFFGAGVQRDRGKKICPRISL
jgi:DNA-binding NtrC family response regulator